MSLTYTADQSGALSSFFRGNNVLLLGDAGTGKTETVKKMISSAQAAGKNVAVTASTGIAASLLPSGRTIHSFLRAYPGMDLRHAHYSEKSENLADVDVLVIDEISMLGKQFIPYLYQCLQAAKQHIQLIIVGDFFQLPPVHDDYAFKSYCWDRLDLVPQVLHQVVRQDDQEMVDNLVRLKYGDASCLDYFRTYSAPGFSSEEITLCALTKDARHINRERLSLLKGTPRIYTAHFAGKINQVDCAAEPFLILKTGSRVMSIINSTDYVNGSLGTVVGMKSDRIDVLLDDGKRVEFGRHAFDTGLVDLSTGEPSYLWQFPLRPADAITIHKSQGQTLKYANIDAAASWAAGQIYVAVSRARNVAGIHFVRPITADNLRTNESVIQFYNTIDKGENYHEWKRVVGY